MSKEGKILIISGFSGVGKGTVVRYIMDNYPDYQLSVSATTRDPRDSEIPGVSYHYITRAQFEEMIKEDQLLEYAQYVDNYYGTPREFVETNIKKGNNVILEIEAQGALQIKAKKPEAIMIFMLPPDADTLKQRLVGRNTESEEVIMKRLARASEETEYMDNYEYFVINDEIEKCADNINKIATNNEPELPSEEKVQTIKKDILKFSKGE